MITSLIIATIVLWLFFIAMMTIIGDAKHIQELSIPKRIFVVAFVIVDVVYNYTYGAALFLEFATKDRKTLTNRLKGYLREQPESWRGKLAQFMCKYMIEPWDPGHCSL